MYVYLFAVKYAQIDINSSSGVRKYVSVYITNSSYFPQPITF